VTFLDKGGLESTKGFVAGTKIPENENKDLKERPGFLKL